MQQNYYKNAKSAACAAKLRKPPDVYYNQIHNKFSDIILSGEYINQRSIMHAKCGVCGYEWSPIAGSLLESKGCPKCTKARVAKSMRKTHEEFIAQLKQISPAINILNKYETAMSRMECKCAVCGHEWNAKAANLLSGFGCPKCGHERTIASQRLDWHSFCDSLRTVNSNITPLGEYKSRKTPLLCRCNICNYEWTPLPENLLKGEGCPRCKQSHGEHAIVKYLTLHNIVFEQQKRFDGLIGQGGGKLSYDFFVPIANTLIEFQGVQHFRPVERFGGQAQFEIQLMHDELKRRYAKNNGYHLIEIKYTDVKNVSVILNKQLIIGTINNPCIDQSA